MIHQKSKKEYTHVSCVPLGINLFNKNNSQHASQQSADGVPKAPICSADNHNLETCIWHGKECEKSGLQDYVGKCPDGKKGCFAYLPKSYTGNTKKSPLDYQI